MRAVIDDLVVTGVVLVSAIYAVYALGPRTLRARLVAGTASLLLRLPKSFGLEARALRLRGATGAATGGCGGCDTCGSGGTASGAGAPASGAEVRVPLSKIGKRTG